MIAEHRIAAEKTRPKHSGGQLQPISMSPLREVTAADDDVLAMLVEGSFDADIRMKTYFPSRMDAAQALAYCRATEGVVLRLGGKPVGLAVARPDPDAGQGVAIPPGVPELELWVLAAHRGQGKRWFPLFAPWMAQRFDRMIAVAWEDNHAPIALLRHSGWDWLGKSFWTDGSVSGNCEVFSYDLTPLRNRLT
jgi:hypothetical protein